MSDIYCNDEEMLEKGVIPVDHMFCLIPATRLFPCLLQGKMPGLIWQHYSYEMFIQ